ncbi:unnamed protein product, partial [Meganyctiphanes norvegica]
MYVKMKATLQQLGVDQQKKANSSLSSIIFLQKDQIIKGHPFSSGNSVVTTISRFDTSFIILVMVYDGWGGQLYVPLRSKKSRLLQLRSKIQKLKKKKDPLPPKGGFAKRMVMGPKHDIRHFLEVRIERKNSVQFNNIEAERLKERPPWVDINENTNVRESSATTSGIVVVTHDVAQNRFSCNLTLSSRGQVSNLLNDIQPRLERGGFAKRAHGYGFMKNINTLDQNLISNVNSKKVKRSQGVKYNFSKSKSDREKELGAVQQYRSRSITSSRNSSRSASRLQRLKERPPWVDINENTNVRESSATTSGIVSATECSPDSSGSIPLDQSGSRLPPISGDPRRRTEPLQLQVLSTSPENADTSSSPVRRHRHKTKDGEERRTVRHRRGRRSPRLSIDEDNPHTPPHTPTPSPPTTPEPTLPQDKVTHPGHADQLRRQRLAAELKEAQMHDNDSNKESSTEADTEESPDISPRKDVSGDVRASSQSSQKTEASLIEQFPPRERRKLEDGSSGSSDSGNTPPPIKQPLSTPEVRAPSVLSRVDSPAPSRTDTRRHWTIGASDIRRGTGLIKIAVGGPYETSRGAITP